MNEKIRILIIDDEAGFTRMLRLNLEKTERYEVREVTDARQSVSVAREFGPDLILLDVIMPQVDGGDVAARLQSDKKLRTVPIVFLTSSVKKTEVAERGGMIGGFRFISKPVSLPRLLQEIEDALREASPDRLVGSPPNP